MADQSEDDVFVLLAKTLSDVKRKVEKLEVDSQGPIGPQGKKGDKGDPGRDGVDGKDGRDGIDGKAGKDGLNGLPGRDGKDGKDGKDGLDGLDGKDGVSVVDAKVDFDNSLVITLSDGSEIDAGQLHIDPSGSSLAVLKQTSDASGGSGGGTWGSITGTLSDQTDLQTALNAKQATLVSGTNIKTVNGSTLLGSGNLTVSGGGGNIDYGFPGFGLTASTTTFTTQAFTIGSIGSNDIYTVPAGKRAFVSSMVVAQTSGSSQSLYPELKVSGTYYRIGAATTLTSTTVATVTVPGVWSPLYVMEAGETYSINASATGAAGVLEIVEFANTDPLKSAKVLSPVSGDNTIYTGTSHGAVILDSAMRFILTAQGASHFVNGTGSAITLTYKFTSGATTLTTTSALSVNAGLKTQQNVPLHISSGDLLIQNLSANNTGGMAWVNVVERP